MASGGLRTVLRLEGLAYFAISLVIYSMLRGSWMTFAILFLAPDLAFLGYLAGPRVGALAYNVLHSSIGPIVLALAGKAFDVPDLWFIAAIWMAHVGFDRMLGYGLKYSSGFKDTHLGKL
jgi:Domain of unknown function (DUF4260)